MIYADTRPRYQVSIYRTIGPLVFVTNYSSLCQNLFTLMKLKCKCDLVHYDVCN